MRNNLWTAAWVTMVGLAATATAAVPGTVATFDVDEDDFAGSTTATVQIHVGAGGNPGGFVQIRKDLEPGFDIGTQNSVWPEFLGAYAASGVTGAGCDLNVFNTALDSAQLRLRRDVFENGWHFDFGAVVPNANLWESYDVAFDPTWDDATAGANGWTQEVGGPSFADLMASVGWREGRVINETSALVGVDNVRLVPEPGTLGLLTVAAVALAARRRQR